VAAGEFPEDDEIETFDRFVIIEISSQKIISIQ
jgi:hypothetical protein